MWLFEYDQEKHIKMEKEESYEDGYLAGEAAGVRVHIVTLIIKMNNKGKTVSEIADILDEPIEVIQKILDVAEKYAPEYEIQKICREIENEE